MRPPRSAFASHDPPKAHSAFGCGTRRRFSRVRTDAAVSAFFAAADPELLAQKGTGVGLYTSWRIIQLHGGRMDAQSVPNEWAEFSFEVPQPLRADANVTTGRRTTESSDA